MWLLTNQRETVILIILLRISRKFRKVLFDLPIYFAAVGTRRKQAVSKTKK